MAFINNLNKTLNDEYNYSMTENGALGYRTTGKDLLDLNFAVASLRSATENQIAERFESAFYDNREAAMRWLFYARDVRGGLGERRLFRVVLGHMANFYPEIVTRLIPIIAEYGREDDMWCLLDTPCKNAVISYCVKKLNSDIAVLKKNGCGKCIDFIREKPSKYRN